ncbi:hypothetical protein IP92_01621 [Pseudoduganella flava]|uniref:Uncharacterized protein n=1 Tax=Pseudoduganella flava TaxID=871742 RepID=A0A562Q132_9BURK|nr:hypothetical protein [Pseudoduganella flava]QGZ38094.1 hypothetical protein GO485_02880 [Pseudoduganella flava]TWI50392.1 hypothetical protein IP92_01621 [Pseudoduganella flava]
MANSRQRATDWLSFLLTQDLPFGEALRSQIAAGSVRELCECGCEGFAFAVPVEAKVQRLQDGAGVFYEVAFTSNYPEEIDILLFTDERGNLSWVDVTYGASNIGPMPADIVPDSRIGGWPATPTDLPAVPEPAADATQRWWEFWR